MTQPLPEVRGVYSNIEALAKALSLDSSLIDQKLPVETVYNGIAVMLVPYDSRGDCAAPRGRGQPYASCAAGPLAHPLLALDDGTLLALADAAPPGAAHDRTARDRPPCWCRSPRSAHAERTPRSRCALRMCGAHTAIAVPLSSATMSAPSCSPRELSGTATSALRAGGAHTIVAVPLSSRGEQLGALIVTDSRELEPSTERVELLELVAAQAASCLRTSAAVAELRHRAATDPLTGLGHRGTFREILAATHRRPIAAGVALCDIDHFKDLNDSAGHQAGDRALQVVAQALQSALRRGDTLYRLGGDEFAALLAVRDENDALAAAHRMREAVAESDAGVTVSVGVAVSAASESDDSLVGRADRALYRAKGAGRNGVGDRDRVAQRRRRLSAFDAGHPCGISLAAR